MESSSFGAAQIPLLQFTTFPSTGLFHFMTTVEGGVSEGNYCSFNLGRFSTDIVSSVATNFLRLQSVLPTVSTSLFVPHQTHGVNILTIDSDFLSLSEQRQTDLLEGVDALVTNCRHCCIAIATADCLPVILYDPVCCVLAAIHAGWRGTVGHIADKTLLLMTEKYGCRPENIRVGMGACISMDRFEVGEEVVSRFQDAGFDLSAISFIHTETGKTHISLQNANRISLLKMGVKSEHIEAELRCTYGHPELFFSARRQGIDSGRMLTGGILL